MGQVLAVGVTGIRQSLRRHVKGQPMSWINRTIQFPRNTITLSIKFKPLKQRSLGRIGAVRHAALRSQVVFEAQALGRHPSKGLALRKYVFPKFARRVGIGKTTSHADDGYRIRHDYTSFICVVTTIESSRKTLLVCHDWT